MTTILIVEDEPSIAELIAFTLKEAGWSSFVVSNAAAAWDFVQHRAPQLVLLDWMLPDRSGLHLLSRIRADRQRLCRGHLAPASHLPKVSPQGLDAL